MELKITSNVKYYNINIFTPFLRDNSIQPNILHLDFDLISRMQANAFTGESFEKVHNLTITNLRVQSLSANSFVGLNSLRFLALLKTQLTHIPDCLHGIASTLHEIVVTGSMTHREMFRLSDGLLSGVELPFLQHLQLKLNLLNSVIGDPFKSTRLISIDLSKCRIEYIHTDAFYTIQDSVKHINLSGNVIKTLPTGMFSYLLPRESLIIDLSNNPWDCECHLSELRKNLRMYDKNFPTETACVTPEEFQGLSVRNASFCGKIAANITDDDDNTSFNFMVVRCPVVQHHSSDEFVENVVVRHREIRFNIVRELKTENVALHIYPNAHGENKRIVAFTAMQQSDILVVSYHCNCENTPIALNQRLTKSQYNVLCLQDMSTRMTIAQNCIAYQLNNQHLIIWLLTTDRVLTICVLVGTYFLMIFFGGIIMVIIYGRFVSYPSDFIECASETRDWR